MKLYATTTSNRASKGQGGDYLKIDIRGAKEEQLWNINITPYDLEFKGYIMKIWTSDGHYLESVIKGNNQKGECLCTGCGVTCNLDEEKVTGKCVQCDN